MSEFRVTSDSSVSPVKKSSAWTTYPKMTKSGGIPGDGPPADIIEAIRDALATGQSKDSEGSGRSCRHSRSETMIRGQRSR